MPDNDIEDQLVWTDRFNSRVASYPPSCLPSNYTIYRSVYLSSYFPLPGRELSGIGLGLAGGGIAAAFAAALPTFATHQWESYYKHIFAQCEYRHNEPLILTQEMIETGIVEMPDYIFEIISVSPEKVLIPPYVKPVLKYTVNLYESDPTTKIEIQLELFIKTEVTWEIAIFSAPVSGATEITYDTAHIDENGLLTIYPARWGEGSLILEVTASNLMGNDMRSVKCEFIYDTDQPFLQTEKSDDKLPAKDEIDDWIWQRTADGKKNIQPNILRGIVPNKLGVYFRLDNATNKSFDSKAQTGIQALVQGASYNDGSSRKFEIDFTKDAEAIYSASDILYVTYCAVKEHYMRQTVAVSWSAFDFGYMGFNAFPSKIRTANYRFYEWELRGTENPDDDPETTSTKVSGWRCVETFNMYPNITGILTLDVEEPTLANFLIGEHPAVPTIFRYLPSSTPVYEILDMLDEYGNEIVVRLPTVATTAWSPAFGTPTKLSTSTINLTALSGREGYQINQGFYQSEKDSSPVSLWNTAEWADSYLQFEQLQTNYSKIIDQCLFNVSPDALKKRDVDKWAIPVALANSLKIATAKGQDSYFPFMDDPEVNEPHSGTTKTLDSSNFLTEPLNAGRLGLGSVANKSGQGARDVLGELSSGAIHEQFKRGTKVLVERAPSGVKNQLYIRCAPGALDIFVSAINDLNLRNAYLFTTHSDGFLSQRKTNYAMAAEDLKKLTFQPDQGGISYSDADVETRNDANPVIGFCGLLGDSPGVFPSKVVSFYKFSDKGAFKEYYVGKPKTQLENKIEISAVFEEYSCLFIQLGELVYTGNLKIEFSLPLYNLGDDFIDENLSKLDKEVLIIFSNGNSVESAIDRVPLSLVKNTKNEKIKMTVNVPNYHWTKGDSLRVCFSNLETVAQAFNAPLPDIDNISILGIQSDFAKDFTTGETDVTKLSEDLKIWKGSDFIKTSFAVSHVDSKGNLCVFFSDEEKGISCIHSVDEGTTWTLQFGLIQLVKDQSNIYPFGIKSSVKEGYFLFFVRNEVLYVMPINLEDLNYEDEFQMKKKEDKTDIFFTKLRNNPLYVVAGNNDTENIEFVQTTNRFTLGTSTIFANVPFTTPFFSGYQKNNGELRIYFSDSKGQVQCSFSSDNGISWYDLWVCMKEGNDGLVKMLDQYGQIADSYPYGINPHFFLTTEEQPETEEETEAKVESPYAYYSPRRNQSYLFYVYKKCLLCKMFRDPLSCQLIRGGNNYDIFISDLAQTHSVFIDGNADNIKDEIGKNVIMKHLYAIDQFDEKRAIDPQRFSAIEERNGNVKIFYKTSDDDAIRAAWQDGYSWVIEDMMHVPEEEAQQ